MISIRLIIEKSITKNKLKHTRVRERVDSIFYANVARYMEEEEIVRWLADEEVNVYRDYADWGPREWIRRERDHLRDVPSGYRVSHRSTRSNLAVIRVRMYTR